MARPLLKNDFQTSQTYFTLFVQQAYIAAGLICDSQDMRPADDYNIKIITPRWHNPTAGRDLED